MATANALLDLSEGIGQRQATFKFFLSDRFGVTIGDLYPDLDSPPKIDLDTTRFPKRQLSGLVIPADQAADINTVADRVRPVMVTEDGTAWPLGLFLFSDASEAVYTYGNPLSTIMHDQGIVIAADLGGSFSMPVGTSAYDAMVNLFAGNPVSNFTVDPTTFTLGAPLTYAASDTFAKVMSDLATVASYFDTYFDNTGRGRLRAVPPPTLAVPTVPPYEVNTRIFNGSIVRATNLLSAPNRFVVVDSSATTTPIMAVYDLPDSAPNSYANRGFRVTKQYSLQGLGSQLAALQAAYAISLRTVTVTIHWSSPPDPRHDTWDFVQVLGDLYLETRWSMTLREGEPMTHEAVRIWV